MNNQNGRPQPMSPLQAALMKIGGGDVTIRLANGDPSIIGKLLALQDGALICVVPDGRIVLVNAAAWSTVQQSAIQLAQSMPVQHLGAVQ